METPNGAESKPSARTRTIRFGLWPNRAVLVTVETMTTVATCSNPAEAMLLKSLLEANAITAYVPEELTAQAAPDFSGSGLRVQVDDENAVAAKRLIEEAAIASDDGEAEDEEPGQPR